MLRKIINDLIRLSGYQFSKIYSVENRIRKGEFSVFQNIGIKTIIDVGANVGQFSLMIDKIVPNCNIYAFEPLRLPFEELKKNTLSLKNIKCLNCGLGKETSESIIHHNQFSPSSSLLEMREIHKKIFPSTSNSREEVVKIEKLDDFSKTVKMQKKILLKIDVQGFELNVLKGANELLCDIDIIIVETSFYEFYENQPLFNHIHNHLVNRDYIFTGFFDELKDVNSGRLLQSDSIFVNKSIWRGLNEG